MSTIELYEVLKKIPRVSEEQAKSVADTLAHTDDVVTKADLKIGLAKLRTELKTDLAEIKAEMIRWNIIIAGTIIAAMGLMFTAARFFSGQ